MCAWTVGRVRQAIARQIVTGLRHDAAVDPAAARGRAIVFQLVEILDECAVSGVHAVDLAYDHFEIRFIVAQ